MAKNLFIFKLLVILFFLIFAPLTANAALVVVDPGHGGWDTGAVGPTGYKEKTANLDIGLKLKQLLINGGYQVVMTRENDISPNNPPQDLTGDGKITVTDDLEARVRIANRAKANVFVAVHNNAGPSSAEGVETYYWADNGEGYNPDSKKLAALIQQELVKETGLYDRGVKFARFYVISPNRLKMPGALVEGAFISNPLEEALLKTASFRQKIAQGIYNGIKRFQPPNNINVFSVDVPAKTRRSVYLNDYLANFSFGLKLTSTASFLAERAIYFNANGFSGSTALGQPKPKKRWYFAEGYTASGFNTWILLANPTSKKANVKLIYYLENGMIKIQTVQVKPHGRQTVFVDKLIPAASFSTKIISNYPVVAERSMYFNTANIKGVSTNFANSRLRKKWFFAGGMATSAYDTWLLLFNPNTQTATAKITFFRESSGPVSVSLNLPPQRRTSVLLDNYVSGAFGFKIESNLKIAAERSIYFDYQGKNGGHSIFGRSKPALTWYFTEGYTGAQFETNYTLLNPNPLPANVKITYFTNSGSSITSSQTVSPYSLATVLAQEPTQIGPNKEFSAIISSDQPILAERFMYYNVNGLSGGAAEFGAYGPAKRRLFAEGFTGPGFDSWLLLFNPHNEAIKINVRFLK